MILGHGFPDENHGPDILRQRSTGRSKLSSSCICESSGIVSSPGSKIRHSSLNKAKTGVRSSPLLSILALKWVMWLSVVKSPKTLGGSKKHLRGVSRSPNIVWLWRAGRPETAQYAAALGMMWRGPRVVMARTQEPHWVLWSRSEARAYLFGSSAGTRMGAGSPCIPSADSWNGHNYPFWTPGPRARLFLG